MSTEHDQPFHNDTSQAERRAVLQQDRAGTYFEHARSNAELGGRFSPMAKETVVTGSAPFVHLSGQPATSPWGSSARLPDEPALGVDINAVGDVTTLDGKPRAKPETGK
jgi:hypothetical protein